MNKQGRHRNSGRLFRKLIAGTTATAVVVLTVVVSVAADTGEDFEINIPIDTVVRNVGVGSTVLLTDPPVQSPDHLVERECTVVAVSNNQSSVHPGNDLIIETGTSQVVISDVEAEPGRVVNSSGTVVLGSEVAVSLRMGPDDVFSAGIEIEINCAPGATTTTTDQDTTTTDQDTTTTDQDTTTTDQESSTSVTSSSDSTEETNTTTSDAGDTVVTTTEDDGAVGADASTSTAVDDEVLGTEVLPFTGPDSNGYAFIALWLVAVGILLLTATRAKED